MKRLSTQRLREIESGLGERDRAILDDLARVRLLNGAQLDRLQFHQLNPRSAPRSRSRVMRRLAELQLVTTLNRRVGGVRAGSSGLIYALDIGGQRLTDTTRRGRRPWTPGRLFTEHTLAVSELFVQLREAGRQGLLELLEFEAEPACWWPHVGPDGARLVLKPDAYVVTADAKFEHEWWIEVDRGTESLPTIRRKLDAYQHLFRSGQPVPGQVFPQVAFLCGRDEARQGAIADLITKRGEDVRDLFVVGDHKLLIPYLEESA